MLVWIIVVFVWLFIPWIICMSINGNSTVDTIGAILFSLIVIDLIAFGIWASWYVLAYYQAWPFIPQ